MRNALPLTDETGMHRITLRFPPELERAFYNTYFTRSLFRIRMAFLLALVCLAAAWPLSERLFPEQVTPARLLLLLLGSGVLAVGLFTFTSYFKRWMRLSLALAYVQFGLYPIFLLTVGDPDTVAVGSLALVILLIFLFTISPLGWVYATATGAPLLAVWFVVLFQPGMTPPHLTWVYVALLLSAFAALVSAGYFIEAAVRRDFVQQRLLASEREKSDRLLFQTLPRPIANRMREQPGTIAETFEDVTVLFADLAGFTEMSQRVSPEEMVETLNLMFSTFDSLSQQYGLEKIKTIGDGYMVVGGLPEHHPDHTTAMAEVALEMQRAVRDLAALKHWPLNIRIGINCGGPVVAGVIGKNKFVYEVWGDVVNTASRMESHGLPDCIQVTEATYERLAPAYALEERGVIEVKSKGLMRTFWLLGRRS